MVFLQKGERPIRFDWRYSEEDHRNIYEYYIGNYTFSGDIESYNRIYHYP